MSQSVNTRNSFATLRNYYAQLPGTVQGPMVSPNIPSMATQAVLYPPPGNGYNALSYNGDGSAYYRYNKGPYGQCVRQRLPNGATLPPQVSQYRPRPCQGKGIPFKPGGKRGPNLGTCPEKCLAARDCCYGACIFDPVAEAAACALWASDDECPDAAGC